MAAGKWWACKCCSSQQCRSIDRWQEYVPFLLLAPRQSKYEIAPSMGPHLCHSVPPISRSSLQLTCGATESWEQSCNKILIRCSVFLIFITSVSIASTIQRKLVRHRTLIAKKCKYIYLWRLRAVKSIVGISVPSTMYQMLMAI